MTPAPPTVTIMAMTADDLDAVLAIDLASFHAETPAAHADPRGVREAQLREELARPWGHLRVARAEDGALLGYLLFWHVVDELHLLNVAVAGSARRRGIGRALMDDLFAYGRANAAATILLEVRAGNHPAIALYAAFGFEHARVRPRYYADGEDGVEMYRTL